MSDAHLIASAPSFPGPHHETEMDRRLKDAVEKLTGEITAFRESSERPLTRVA
jgi:hypothetical protein